MAIFRSVLTFSTCSMSESGALASRAVRIRAVTSFGKAGPAIARAGMQKFRADAAIGADRGRHLLHVSPNRLAEIGDLVDERHLHRQKGIGGIFGEFRRFRG